MVTLEERVTVDTLSAVAQLQAEMTSAINSGTHHFSSIATAMQHLSTNVPSAAKPKRIDDLIPKHREGSIKEETYTMKKRCKSESRALTSSTTTACRWTTQQKKSFENSKPFCLFQILDMTTINDSVQGQKGFEVWHQIVRIHDQRNTSDKHSPCAALVSNIVDMTERKTRSTSKTSSGRSSRKLTSTTAGSARSEMRRRCSQSRS